MLKTVMTLNETVERTTRLSHVLFGSRENFNSFAALPSNVEAIESCLRFTACEEPFVCLVGPSAWGKSHLLRATADRISQLVGHGIDVMRVERAVCAAYNPALPLVIDDVHDALERPRLRFELQRLLENRVRAGRPTLLAVTSSRPSRALRSLLFGREWRLETVAPAEGVERVLLVRHLAQAEDLALSSRLVAVLAKECHGNALTLRGALNRLRLDAYGWLTDRAALRALGRLDPFFVDNAGWDLADTIRDVIEEDASAFPAASLRDFMAYAMLREAQLAEGVVARTLRIEPAEAFVRATRYESQRALDPQLDRYADTLADRVLTALGG